MTGGDRGARPTRLEVEMENEELRLRLAEAEQTLEAIRSGQVDSLVVEGPGGLRVYTLEGASNTYRVMIEAITEGAATLSEEGILLYSNGRFARMLDRPLQRMMGGSIRDLVPESARPELDALLREALEGEGRGELPMLTGSGEEIPVHLSATAIHDDARRVLCLVATDLRAQKRSEDLLAAERLARSMLEQAAEAIVVCDDRGAIIRASGAAAELCSCNPIHAPFEAALPLTVSDGDRDMAEGGVVAAALRGETFRAVRATLHREDGRRLEVLVSGAPLQGASGGVIGCVITLVDVTRSRRAEEALRESEARFRALADNISQLAWMADERGWTFWYNRRWSQYTGAAPEAAKGWGWTRVVHPDHQERVAAKIARCFETGDPWEDTFPLLGKDGQYRWFLARAQPIRDETGRVVRWFGTNTDITMQREAEEALRQAISLRDQFLSVASHELRTPLTALSLQLEGLERLLVRETDGNERALRKTESAIRQTDRLGRLVEGLLNVSRIVSGQFQLHLETFDLSDAVRETLERLGDLAARAGCELKLTAHGSTVGTWDRSRIEQVITNLLTNAIKYGPGNPVEIAVEQTEGGVELRVRDQGIGISEEDQQRIFGRFERAVPSSHYGGLGLGLYISREIALAHGGTIEVRSAPGRGATFTVRLPPVAPSWASPPEPAPLHAEAL